LFHQRRRRTGVTIIKFWSGHRSRYGEKGSNREGRQTQAENYLTNCHTAAAAAAEAVAAAAAAEAEAAAAAAAAAAEAAAAAAG
jgi:hypothetical protein